MAKAQITTTDGLTIRVDGTPNEIAQVVRDLREATARPAAKAGRGKRQASKRVLLVDLIESLADAEFFKKPKDLAALKAALEEMGHHYPVTTLSGAMLTKVRKRRLRRIKDKRRWMYVG